MYSLFNDDCLKVLDRIEPESFDLVFADPPFNLGKDYEDNLDKEYYFNWCLNWISKCWKCLKPNGSFFLMTIQDYVGKMMEFLGIVGWFRNQIIWLNSSMPIKDRFCIGYQPILYYVKDINNYTFNYGVERRTSNAAIPWGRKNNAHSIKDIWDDIPFVSGGCMASKEAILIPGTKKKAHTAQMPLRLAERIIKYCSNKGDIVCDPFMGSGTTGVASLKLDRKFVGIEIDKIYFVLTQNRIENKSIFDNITYSINDELNQLQFKMV